VTLAAGQKSIDVRARPSVFPLPLSGKVSAASKVPLVGAATL